MGRYGAREPSVALATDAAPAPAPERATPRAPRAAGDAACSVDASEAGPLEPFAQEVPLEPFFASAARRVAASACASACGWMNRERRAPLA